MKTTKSAIFEAFREHNRARGYDYHSNSKSDISAVIVYSASNWSTAYTETQRSYRIYNNSGKAFFDGMIGSSVYGDCLDGVDLGVRLDWVDWKIERCYFEVSPEEMNRSVALEIVKRDADKMTEAEIVGYLLDASFREAEAWKIAEDLKRKP